MPRTGRSFRSSKWRRRGDRGSFIRCGRAMDWKWERGPDGVTPTEYGAAQLIDQTGEIAYWFFVVARQMEKAELAGKLA